MNLHKRIRRAMRQNEVELLAHLRAYRVIGLTFFGRAWLNALDRLKKGGMVRFRDGQYKVRKGGRPVTGAVR